MNWGRRRRHRRFWTSSKKREAIYESKNFGLDYLTQKYGQDRVNQIVKDIERSTLSPGRGRGDSKYTNQGGDGPGRTRYVKGRGYVKVGSSSWNRPRKMDPSKYKSQAGTAAGKRFSTGGPLAPHLLPPPPDKPGFPPGTFKPRMKLNLENDEELAQGSQTPWAQPTTISSTITGLLRQAQNASSNYWDQWSQDKGGQIALDTRGSSVFGVDMRWTPQPPSTTTAAMENPMGAFGVEGTFSGFPATTPTLPPTTTPTTPKPPSSDLPPETKIGDNPMPPHGTPKLPPNSNPWGFGYGGEKNAYGPNPTTMANSTLEAMALANAYFAPQRMELAYELGDMETDMRRLAVNLGRQVDDPVLQAKLYKEAMRSVRTLDVQQNTFAFQMAEQRRREELQNFQFYDQLAQEEYRLRLQNMQFYEQLDLQSQYFNLERYKVAHPPTSTTTTTTGPTSNTPLTTPAMQPGLIQRQFQVPQSAPQQMNLGGNLLGLNPYAARPY